MVCSGCQKQIEWCECQKNNEIVKQWPKGTWFQERLKKVMIAQANGKQDTRDAGYSLIEVMCFFAITGLILLGLVTFSVFARQVFQNFQAVERCIQALLECVTI